MSKQAEISSGKVVGAVIVLLIVLVVAGFAVEKNPNWYYKLIPDADQVYNDVDEEIKIPVGSAVNPCTASGQVLVAKIIDSGVIQIRRQDQNEKTFLERNTYYTDNSLTWNRKQLMFDSMIIGSYVNDRVVINSIYLKQDTSFYLEMLNKKNYFTAKDLAILDGTELKGNYFCKTINNGEGYISSRYVAPWPERANIPTMDLTPMMSSIYSSNKQILPSGNNLNLAPYLFFVSSEDKYIKDDAIFIKANSANLKLELYFYRDGKETSPFGFISPDGYIWLIVPKTYYLDGTRRQMTNDYFFKGNRFLTYYQKNTLLWVIPWPGETIKESGWKLGSEVKFDFEDYADSSSAYVKSNIKVDYNYLKNNL